MTDDAEAEAEAAELPRRAGVTLPESLEKMRRNLRFEADSRVADGKPNLMIVLHERHSYLPA